MVSGAFPTVRKDDLRFMELQKTLAQKKQQQIFVRAKTKDIKSDNAIAQGRIMGREVANRKGSQFILIGEYHKIPAAMDAFLGVIQGLKDGLKTPRQIIVLREGDPQTSSTAKAFKKWNEGGNEKGSLGSMVAAPASITKWQDDIWSVSQECPDYLDDLYVPAALNKASDLFPDLKAFDIDVNSKGYDPFKKIYDPEMSDRDSAMVLRIAELQKTYPDAIFVGVFGSCHVPKQMADGKTKWNGKNILGMNLDDPLGEQLSLLHGADNVHAMTVMLENDGINVDSSDKIVTKNKGQFDMVVRVKKMKDKKDWHRQWLLSR